MDGTLIDSSKLLANTINYVREQIGLCALKNEIITKTINDTSINPARFFYESEHFEEIHEKHFHAYYHQNHHKQTKLYEGIGTLLDKLSKTHHLSVATNAYDVSTAPLLDALGIAKYFEIVVCANQVEKAKPHPMMLEKIVDFYKADKKSFLMIGDGERDIAAAHNAGIDALLVDWGFSDHEDALSSVDELGLKLGVRI